MAEIILFGSGLVGKTIAMDLAKDHHITVVDIDQKNLEKLPFNSNLHPIMGNAFELEFLKSVCNNKDIIIGALPGHLGYSFLERVIPFGIPIVDISFFPEDPFGLQEITEKHNNMVAVDCGVAPGMSNIICGHYSQKIDMNSFKCMVGGLPQNPEWPFKYKAVFSPRDVIEEYTRPARFVTNGKEVTKEALTDLEVFNVDSIGELEAFNTDGLRTLLNTMDIPNMVEKTVRYYGTTQYIKMLKKLDFFSSSPILLGNQEVCPVDVSAELLKADWMMSSEDRDMTVMKMEITGKHDNQAMTIEYLLLDTFDETTGNTSMARTTGFTCTSIVNYILSGSWKKTGVCPPEYFGMDYDAYEYIHRYLQDRGVIYKKITKS